MELKEQMPDRSVRRIVMAKEQKTKYSISITTRVADKLKRFLRKSGYVQSFFISQAIEHEIDKIEAAKEAQGQ